MNEQLNNIKIAGKITSAYHKKQWNTSNDWR